MFLVAASVKLWLVSDLAAFAFARRKLTPHRGGDLLGQTGIGRLFFSGIRIGLAPGAIPDAEPTVQITGLACPASAPDRVLKDSNLLATLREFQADNHTTQGLASIILAHAHWPYFLGIPGFVWVK